MSADNFPTFRAWFRFAGRCLRRLRRIFLSRRSLVVYLILFTLVFLAYTIDRWHGRRAWEAEKARLAAAGESLDLRELLPKRPPDEENFCAIPALAKLGDPSDRLAHRDDPLRMWLTRDSVERPTVHGKLGKFRLSRPKGGLEAPLEEWCRYFRETGMLPAQPLSPDPATELLLSAKRWENLLNAMYAAIDRPTAIFLPAPVDRLDANGQLNPQIAGADLWFPVTDLAQAIVLHGRACIGTGDVHTARMDILVLRRFAEAFRNEPGFELVLSGFLNRICSDIVRAGMRGHLWSADDLNRITEDKVSRWMPTAWRKAVLVDRAGDSFYTLNPKLATYRHIRGYSYTLRWKWPWLRNLVERIAPSGPILRHCADRSRYRSLHAGAMDQLQPGETWIERNQQLQKIQEPSPPPFVRFAGVSEFGGVSAALNILFRHRLLETACALERHHLTHRRYPGALDELPMETFIDVDGQPLKYRTAPDGSTFRVWSVGLNGRDDTSDPNVKADKNDDWSFSIE